MAGIQSERQAVEEYLKLHCIQECLDEVINDLVERRPLNPYIAITKMMETKTLSEITDIQISTAVTGRGSCGVLATVLTNIGSFSASMAYPYDSPDSDSSSDYTTVQDTLRDVLNHVDPRDISNVDRVLDTLTDLDDTLAMAVSMACCRAGAKHRGVPLYRHLNDGLEEENKSGEPVQMRIPLPVISVLSRARVDDGAASASQDILVFPVGANHVDRAIDSVRTFQGLVLTKIAEKGFVHALSDCGCVRLSMQSVDEALKFVSNLVLDSSIRGLKVGFDLRASSFSSSPHTAESAEKVLYSFQNSLLAVSPSAYAKPPSAKGKKTSGAVVVTDHGPLDADAHLSKLANLFRETLFISVEDPVHAQDVVSLINFKNRIFDGLSEADSNLVNAGMLYSETGVGDEAGCSLQIVADANYVTAKEINSVSDAGGAINAIKIRLDKVSTVSRALEMSRVGRMAGLAVIVGYSESGPESLDPFIADLCVGLGAGQLMGGGLLSGEYFSKYVRLSEISREDSSIPFAGKKFRC